jgi:hypothetical protein
MFRVQLIETFEAPIVMTTFFIRQEIDIGVHDIMYQVSKDQVSKEHVDIVKPMVHNEFQQAKDFEVVRANLSNNSLNNVS